MGRGEILCSASYFGLPNFESVDVGVRVRYADDSYSAFAYSKVSTVTRPYVTPTSVREAYSIVGASCSTNSSQSVPEFYESFSPDDATMFFQLMSLPKREPNVVGFNNVSQPGVEASLDVQTVMGTGVNCETTVWNVEGSLMDWLVQLANDSNPPLVHSISYG